MTRASDRFEHSLDQISRKFIRRAAKDAPEVSAGYDSLVALGADVEAAVDLLLSFDATSKPAPANSEFWIRIANDYVSDVEDWPYAAAQHGDDAVVDSVRSVCARLNAELVARASVFTQTQRTRLLSLAMRARQATHEQLFTDTVAAFGESLAA